MLNFVEMNGGDQLRIHLMLRLLAQDQRFLLGKAIQGCCAQRLVLIKSAGKQLSLLCLGAAHPEVSFHRLLFFGGEVSRLLPFLY